jgi:hypothetical protein
MRSEGGRTGTVERCGAERKVNNGDIVLVGVSSDGELSSACFDTVTIIAMSVIHLTETEIGFSGFLTVIGRLKAMLCTGKY